MESLLPTLLLVLFVGLKLAGVIDWSWWWVMAPLWIPALIAVAAVSCLAFIRWRETPQQKAARLLREYGEALSRKS